MTMTDTAGEEGQRRLTAVVAADICGYSRLAEADESAAVRTVNAVHAIFEHRVTNRRGRIFHRAGDGFLAEFPSAADAVLAALEFVTDIRRRDTLAPNGLPAKVRAGVHVGDVLEAAGGDLMGHGVNVAARLQAEAEPGGVLVSLHTVNIVRGKIEASFRRRGPLALKNIDEPIVAFDVEAGGAGDSLFRRAQRRLSRSRSWVLPAVSAMLLAVIALMLGNSVFENGRASPERRQAASGLNPIGDTLSRADAKYQDDAAIRMILQRLSQSESREDKLILALIESGDVGHAIESLEKRYRDDAATLGRAGRVDYLMQIGALAFERYPTKAVEAYRAAIALQPDDASSLFEARMRLGRLLLKQGRSEEARRTLMQALQEGDPGPEARLKAQDYIAYSYLHERRMPEAIQSFERALQEARRLEWPVMISRIQTNLGMAYAVAGDEGKAKDYLVPIMAYQANHGFDDEKARALSSMGHLAENAGRYDEAENYYRQAYALEESLGRISNIVDNLLSLARVDMAIGQNSRARINLDEAHRLSRENGLRSGVIFSLIGNAVIDAREGLNASACERISEVERMDSGGANYNQFNRSAIEETGCAFAPFGLSARDTPSRAED